MLRDCPAAGAEERARDEPDQAVGAGVDGELVRGAARVGGRGLTQLPIAPLGVLAAGRERAAGRDGDSRREGRQVRIEAKDVCGREAVTRCDVGYGGRPDVGFEAGTGGTGERRHSFSLRKLDSWVGEGSEGTAGPRGRPREGRWAGIRHGRGG